jgi:hypothetical protein
MAKKATRGREYKAQREFLMLQVQRALIRGILRLHDKGWTPDEIAAEVDVMMKAIGDTMVTDLATNGEIDLKTYEFTIRSVESVISVDKYAETVADCFEEMKRKEGE